MPPTILAAALKGVKGTWITASWTDSERPCISGLSGSLAGASRRVTDWANAAPDTADSPGSATTRSTSPIAPPVRARPRW